MTSTATALRSTKESSHLVVMSEAPILPGEATAGGGGGVGGDGAGVVTLPAVLPSSAKRRRRLRQRTRGDQQPPTGCHYSCPRQVVAIDDERGMEEGEEEGLLPLLRSRLRTTTITTASCRNKNTRRSTATVRAKAIVACGCLLGGVGTAVTALSAVCSPPPQPHQLIATPTTTQVPPQPHARRFLEDIISGQTASPPEPLSGKLEGEDGVDGAAPADGRAGAWHEQQLQQQALEEQNKPTTKPVLVSSILGQTENTAVFRSAATLAPPAPRPAPFPREVRAEADGESQAVAARVVRAPNVRILAAKEAPKYGYEPSSDRRQQAIQRMCAELCQTKLLTRAEEYDMGTKIQGLMQYTAVRESLATRLGRRPSFEEWAESCCMTEPELKESLRICGSAKQAMIRANMRMVISIARKYQHYGVPLTDLIQEGSLGLVRAVEKFDPERGFKLSTYSAWWIQQAVFKGIAHQSRVIRLPVHVHNLLNRIRRAQRELTSRAGEQPTDLQIALHLDMPLQRLKRYQTSTRETLSFEVPAGARSFQLTKERVLGDTLESRERRAPEKEGDMLLFRDRLREIVKELPEDERTVVSLRFGLDNGKPKTIGQVADIVQTTPPFVRRVEGLAMRKLRSPDQQRRLREFNTMHPPAPAAAPAEEELVTAA